MTSLDCDWSAARLTPGDALPSQHELARQLGVSRPVLREAMQVLAARGVLTIRPGSGCYVGSAVDATEPEALLETVIHHAALEALEARLVVEVELAGLAAERGSEDDLRALELLLARLDRAVSLGADTAGITDEFHRALNRAGHNMVLFRMAEMPRPTRTGQGHRIEHALPDIKAGEPESHRRLYEAVRSGQVSEARSEMRRHLELAHGWERKVNELRNRAMKVD